MNQSVSDMLKARTVAALAKHDETIRERIVAAARKMGHAITTSDIQRVELLKISDESHTVTPSFGSFVTKQVSVATRVDQAAITNNSAAVARYTVRYGERETQEFNWSITNGVTHGASITEKAQVPGLSSEVTLKMDMSVSATSGQAWRNEKDWSNETEVTLPPYSAVHIQAALVRVIGDLPFSLEVHETGKADCRVTLSYHGTRTRSFQIGLSELLSAAERTFTVVGTISGACGISCTIDIHDAPLTAEERQALPEGVSTMADSLGTLELAAGV